MAAPIPDPMTSDREIALRFAAAVVPRIVEELDRLIGSVSVGTPESEAGQLSRAAARSRAATLDLGRLLLEEELREVARLVGKVWRWIIDELQEPLVTLQNRTFLNNLLSTQVFSTATKTWTLTSAGGRILATTLDGNDNVVKSRPVGRFGFDNLLPTNFVYDPHGRLSSITRGSRIEQGSYFDNADASNGYLSSALDALSQTTTYQRDAFGRALGEQSPDGALTAFAWDPSGNLSSLTPPARPAHSLNYTAVDQISDYKPPTLASLAKPNTTYEYNLAHQPTKVTRPDGAVLNYAYDGAGRLVTVTTPDGILTNRYFDTTRCMGCAPGKVSQILGVDAVNLAFTFDGLLQTGTLWTGAVSGSVKRTYTGQFQVASETIAAGSNTSSVSFSYDGDGVLQAAGAMTLGASSDDGQFSDDRLINVIDYYGYNGFAEFAAQSSYVNSVQVFRETLDDASASRDALGRIVQKTETLQGAQTVFRYAYDANSRLKSVTTDGVQTASYVYDPNGNRSSAATTAGTSIATYDDQDRLLTYGTPNEGGSCSDGKPATVQRRARTEHAQQVRLPSLMTAIRAPPIPATRSLESVTRQSRRGPHAPTEMLATGPRLATAVARARRALPRSSTTAIPAR